LATVKIGCANEVGRAQLKPIPSSQETSTRRLPGAKASRSFSVTNISGWSVCWSTGVDGELGDLVALHAVRPLPSAAAQRAYE
jgi:hypothetical protein